MPTSTSKGFRFPQPGDQNDVPADMGRLAADLDRMPGVESFSTSQRDALPAALRWSGRVIHNTDVNRLQLYTGTAWLTIRTDNDPTACAIVDRGSNLLIPTGSPGTYLPFQNDYVPRGMWSASQPSRITFVEPGVYHITANLMWAMNSTGRRQASLFLDRSVLLSSDDQPANAFGTSYQHVAATVYVADAGQFVELQVEHSASAASIMVQVNGLLPNMAAFKHSS